MEGGRERDRDREKERQTDRQTDGRTDRTRNKAVSTELPLNRRLKSVEYRCREEDNGYF